MSLLQPPGKGGVTEAEAQEVAAMGDEILPLVYDALFSRNAFSKGHSERYALRVLAHTGNKDVIPKIKQYLDRDNRLASRFEALRAILEVSNTAETQQYTAKTVNGWIEHPHQKYDHAIESGLLRLLDTRIPDDDRIALLKEIRISDFRFRAHIMRNLARRADAVTIAALRNLLAEDKPKVTYLAAHSIEYALSTLRRDIQTYSALNLADTQNMTKDDVQRVCAERKRAIEALEKEFDVIKVYHRSAEGGDDRALFQLGYHYLTGNLVRKDTQKAYRYLERSAQKGNSYGQVEIGLCYLNGIGVQKQPEKGFEWILTATKTGYVEAWYQVGLCYRDGRGTPVDLAQARMWLKKAADFPHEEARKTLQELDGIND